MLNAKPFARESDENDSVKIYNPACGAYDDFRKNKLEEMDKIKQWQSLPQKHRLKTCIRTS